MMRSEYGGSERRRWLRAPALRSCPSLRESRPWQPHLHDFERHWPQTQAHEHFICLHDSARKENSEDWKSPWNEEKSIVED